jgi:hypothetical protein
VSKAFKASRGGAAGEAGEAGETPAQVRLMLAMASGGVQLGRGVRSGESEHRRLK